MSDGFGSPRITRLQIALRRQGYGGPAECRLMIGDQDSGQRNKRWKKFPLLSRFGWPWLAAVGFGPAFARCAPARQASHRRGISGVREPLHRYNHCKHWGFL